MYQCCIKRLLEFVFSMIILIALSPFLIVFMILGTIFMRGNPFFVYPRAGKNGKVFKLIKFRSMANLKDEKGEYLPDQVRLNQYGRFLRASSIDELPELLNILAGNMSFVGPRPLTYKYLDYYTEEERHRHDVRPGLTGLAQINGRNAISWEERFQYDLEYVRNVTFSNDVRIIIKTIGKVLKRADIGEGASSIRSLHEIRAKNQSEHDKGETP